MPVHIEDASGYSGQADRSVAPASEAELVEVLREAVAGRIPVTVGGAQTGVTGGAVPGSGWHVSLVRLRSLEVGHGVAHVGAGLSLADLQAAAAPSQFYGPDPTEMTASVGGTIATNASGSRSFRYGDTRRHVRALRAVLVGASAGEVRIVEKRRGEPLDFPVPAMSRPRTTKQTAGYFLQPEMDWVDLFIGSEGTLGVVTWAELQLLPAPEALIAGVVFFRSDDEAIDAVDAWRAGSGARMLEYLDRHALRLARQRYPEIPASAGAAVLFESECAADNEDAQVDQWLERLEHARALTEDSWFAAHSSDRERFRRFRHAVPELVNETVRREGFLKVGSDFAVPVDRNREMLAEYHRRLEREFPGRYVIFGHLGDAHVHVNVLPQTQEEFEAAGRLMVEFARHAVSLGGTVSAEHGLGKRKAHLLPLQFTSEEIEWMKQIKRRLDPLWLLGRNTLFPWEGCS